MLRAALAVASAWILVGCGGAAVAATGRGETTPVSGETAAAGSESDDPAQVAWSQRIDPASSLRAIALRTQRAHDEDDSTSWIAVAQAEHFYASVHATDAAQVIAHAQAGLSAADHALDEEAEDVAAALRVAGQALPDMNIDAAHALYWHARLSLTLANARGFADVLIVDDQLSRALSACERLAESYDNFGASMLLAQRAAHPLDLAQRDLAGARQRIERVMAAEPEFLAHRVAFAEQYAVVASDRGVFERELSAVTTARISTRAPAEQHLAQARATMLLQQVSELFE